MIINQPIISEDTESMTWTEVDVCEILLGYILVIFVINCVHFPHFYLIFDFFFVSGSHF